ncbi:tRNA pseudouridine synthase A [Cimex lectularius]|uniref:Pseudouridylate synthase 1 homolog n=1 Tax=Cimex lectularius TaxID=79782 RepID=A0A8I6TD88_CIMLE|nr:tRNA pseudouridine synthase A [Cimex lectularius]
MFVLNAKINLRPAIRQILRKMINGLLEESTNPLKRVSEYSLDDSEAKKAKPDFQRVKKWKYAVLLSYSGQGYLGLQRNPGQKTIEEELFKALLAANVINEEAYNQPKILDFQRAARTDKGVSAVRQVLSVKLPTEVSLESVNSHLPDQIRMVALKRATKGFNCKGNCDARTYSYMMPTFALAPKDVSVSPDYRVTQDILEKTQAVLQTYVGTHNYHNFTSKKKPLDPSAMRYIISFVCEEPVLCEGMEFVILKVKGQSFMLHQIRKMVGLAIAIVRGYTTEETIKKAWGEERLDLPVAPGAGLVLEEVHYDRYNQRYGQDGIHVEIEWSKEKEQLEEFKKTFILSSIVKSEKEENSMATWLETLPMHTFDIRNVHRHQKPKDDEEEEEEDGVSRESNSDDSRNIV